MALTRGRPGAILDEIHPAITTAIGYQLLQERLHGWEHIAVEGDGCQRQVVEAGGVGQGGGHVASLQDIQGNRHALPAQYLSNYRAVSMVYPYTEAQAIVAQRPTGV